MFPLPADHREIGGVAARIFDDEMGGCTEG